MQRGITRICRVGVVALLLAAGASAQSLRPGMGATIYSGGTTFRVWAPNASAVSVGGTFNAFSTTANPLVNEGNGNWSADVSGAGAGHEYKFFVTNGANSYWRKDPRGREVTNSSGNSIIRNSTYAWSDYGATATIFS
ncbi:MAG: hypothetical protein ACK58T_10450, partial [Phycisphaerae bacterium]